MACTSWFRSRFFGALICAAALAPIALAALPVAGKEDAPPLPDDKIVVDIDAMDEEVFRVGVPDLIGKPATHAVGGADILRNDFRLMPGFRVIGPGAIRHDVVTPGLGVDLGSWSVLGANGVIKGVISESRRGAVRIELRFTSRRAVGRQRSPRSIRALPIRFVHGCTILRTG